MADLGAMSPDRHPQSPPAPVEEDGLKARSAALHLLEAALSRRNGLEEAAGSKEMLALSPRDRAFARALAMATLRHLGPIDRLLNARLAKPPPDAVMHLLRLGAAQIGHLNTPGFAAVTTSVALAEAHPSTRRFKGVVNAVLRSLTREPASVPAAQDFAPSWLYARWRSAYGTQGADALAASIAEEPPTDLSLRSPDDAEALAVSLEGTLLPGGTVRTRRRGDLSQWPGFQEGRWWVQDAAAAMPARLLDPPPGSAVLDLCAAPGGKTLQLAAFGARVTALDRSAARLQRLRENLERIGLAAEVIAADVLAWSDERRFDAVLLDAPCSSTGTFRRHPDVLWAARPSDIAKLAEVQSALLDAAADRVRPEGRLVYCVCSLEPEEGEEQARAFLGRRADFVLEPPQPGEAGAPAAALRPPGVLRLTPSLTEPSGGLDGFYVARFRRRA